MTMYVMTLGELNYHDDFLPWDGLAFPTLTNILFIILVLGMPIIMMNMLVRSIDNIGEYLSTSLFTFYLIRIRSYVENRSCSIRNNFQSSLYVVVCTISYLLTFT